MKQISISHIPNYWRMFMDEIRLSLQSNQNTIPRSMEFTQESENDFINLCITLSDDCTLTINLHTYTLQYLFISDVKTQVINQINKSVLLWKLESLSNNNKNFNYNVTFGMDNH